MQALPLPETAALFAVILGLLVLAHEFGHFVTAKRFGVQAPEFGIGFPPRLLTLWRTTGWVQIRNEKIRIARGFDLPTGLRIGDRVSYSIGEEKGRQVLTRLQIIDPAGVVVPPASTVQKFDRGTTFTFNAVPLGGFVRLSGESDPAAPNALAARPRPQRAVVLAAGVTMNLVLALLAFFALQAAFPQPIVAVTTRVQRFAGASPAAQAGVRAGDLIVSVDGVAVTNNYQAFLAQVRSHCGRLLTIGVRRGDPGGGAQELALEAAPQAIGNSQCALGIYFDTEMGERIAAVAPGSLGARLGLRPGDSLVQVGDFHLVVMNGDWQASMQDVRGLAAYVKAHSQVPTRMPVLVVRDEMPLPPAAMTIPENISPEQAALGLTLSPYPSVPDAAVGALGRMEAALSLFPRALAGIVSGLARGQDPGVAGPIRIAQAVAEGTPSGGLPFIIYLFGALSLNLAVLNLLPFPGLDGGRLAFVLLEALRGGRRVPPRIEGLVHLAGMVLLLAFTLFVSYNDVLRWLAGKSAFSP